MKNRRFERAAMTMKYYLHISVLLFCIFFAGNARGADIREAGIFRIGISSSGFNEVSHNDAAAALKAWAVTVAKEQGLQERIEISLLPSSVEKLRTAMKERRLDGISVSVEELMDLNLTAKDIYIPVTEQGPEARYAVIVHIDGGISSPAEIMNRKVVIGDGGRMNLALPWLETLMVDHATGGNKKLSGLQITTEKPSKAILQVFFQQADAALVDTVAFDLACELNPQIRKRLKKLTESPPFIISFFAFSSSSGQGQGTEKLERAILDLSNTPGGRQVLTVFKSSGMEKYPVSILDSTIQFIQRYRQLANGSSAVEAQP